MIPLNRVSAEKKESNEVTTGGKEKRATGENGGGVAWTRVRCDAYACVRMSRVSESSSESIE